MNAAAACESVQCAQFPITYALRIVVEFIGKLHQNKKGANEVGLEFIGENWTRVHREFLPVKQSAKIPCDRAD